MEVTKELLERLCREIGASNCAVIDVADIVFDADLRKNCEMNYCGEFGRTWVCPPHCGDIEECIQKAQGYDKALVIQTICPLEDSYDFESMEAAAENFHKIFAWVAGKAKAEDPDVLCLSAGGCHLCKKCAVADDMPCRNPEEAYPSLESHGIYVSDLAARAGMNYINGKDTVTYFGAVLYNLSPISTV